MWPMHVDYTNEDCKKVLRSLELEAYSSVVNAFRAQGGLTKDRKKMLHDLCQVLSISMERHRAEIRRVVNDEHLNTIAERLFGPNTTTDWAVEGRRVVPLIHRLAPQTVFSELANLAATAQANRNAALPLPGKTGSKEVNNGIETMARRKRKDYSSDLIASPHKVSALDNPYFGLPFDSTNSRFGQETSSQAPESSESQSEIVPQCSSTPDFVSPKVVTHSSSITASPSKPLSKHVMLKPTSTVTTFSTFDQLTSNLSASRPVQQFTHEEQVFSDVMKCQDVKNAQRSSQLNVGLVKPSATVMPTPVSSPCSTPSTSREPASSKFVPQVRSKTPSRPSIPPGLGLKMTPQQQTSSPGLKVKTDTNTTFFTKKTVFTPDQTTSLTEKQTVSKASVVKPESQAINAKQATMAKGLAKPVTSSSQYISRSLFSTTASKNATKSLSPVIFNVSSTTCTPMQSTCKTTGAMDKSSPQLLPKSNQLKLSNTIQYRNDGGFVKNARIVNISQQPTRMPLTSTAMSALGLSPSALRVTLPSSVRVTGAQKPNVIVVHKAQMWPRTSSIVTTPAITKSNNDTHPQMANSTVSKQDAVSQKQDKISKTLSTKLSPRPIAPAKMQSPITATRVSESSVVLQKDSSSTESHNSKHTESMIEAQCKRNLLADIIEASGILDIHSSREKTATQEKSMAGKSDPKVSNHKEVMSKKTLPSNSSHDNNISRLDAVGKSNKETTSALIPPVERSTSDSHKKETLHMESLETQSRDSCNSSKVVKEIAASSNECSSKSHRELTKDKTL